MRRLQYRFVQYSEKRDDLDQTERRPRSIAADCEHTEELGSDSYGDRNLKNSRSLATRDELRIASVMAVEENPSAWRGAGVNDVLRYRAATRTPPDLTIIQLHAECLLPHRLAGRKPQGRHRRDMDTSEAARDHRLCMDVHEDAPRSCSDVEALTASCILHGSSSEWIVKQKCAFWRPPMEDDKVAVQNVFGVFSAVSEGELAR